MTIQEMRPATVYLLAALAEGRLHGYAIIQAVERSSGAELVLKPGTLYGALERLERLGLVVAAGEEAVDGRLRRYYELTDDGVKALVEQHERLQRETTAVSRGLKARGIGAAMARVFGAGSPVGGLA
jgi:DNA-binding PadR family transcriptional regulator